MTGKYDVIVMPLRVAGNLVGNLVRPRTARQAFDERVEYAEIRKQFREAIESSKTQFRVPIVGEDEDAK